MNIIANPEEAKIKGTNYELGMSLRAVFTAIYDDLGVEAGQIIIDEALNLALKS